MRVPRPPASTTTGWDARGSGTDDDRRAVVVEPEPDLGQPLFVHCGTQRAGIVGEEEEKASAASPGQLAADRPVRPTGLVPAVDVGVRHPLRPLALLDPVLVHELAEPGDVAGHE